MENRILHLTKNDFEGVASAILSKYIYGDNIDIKFFNYNSSSLQYEEDAKQYEYVIAVGLKNSYQLKKYNLELLECKNFEEMYGHYSSLFPEDFKDNENLNIFYENVSAYIDWSWSDKQLYYGKNIDELCKYLGKIEVIEKIAERLSNGNEIVTNIEKEMLVFAKKIMTNSIQNKKYTKTYNKKTDKKIAITYSDAYEIELANHILSQEKDVDAVMIINMNTKIARIKTSKGVNLEKEIIEAGGITNSNGGTIKFGDLFDNNIFSTLLNKIIKQTT